MKARTHVVLSARRAHKLDRKPSWEDDKQEVFWKRQKHLVTKKEEFRSTENFRGKMKRVDFSKELEEEVISYFTIAPEPSLFYPLTEFIFGIRYITRLFWSSPIHYANHIFSSFSSA